MSRKCYSLDFKLKVIEEAENSSSPKKDLCAKFSISPSTLSTFLKNKEKIRANRDAGLFSGKRKKMRSSRNKAVEKALFLWIKQVRTKSVPLSGPVIKEKANLLAREMGVDFVASNGWFYRFKTRRGLTFKCISGEAASVTPEMLNDWKKKKLPSILSRYDASDIYNVDESGLFYQCLPNKTFTLPAERASRGIKESKQRLTMLIGANMTGEDKLDPLIIGKSANPRCFRGIQHIPLPYCSNSKAWMTSQIWTEWMNKFDTRMRKERRKVALIIDNCPAHPVVPNLSNVEVIYLPPNTTSHTQPCDQGIIQALKLKYRSRLLKKFLDSLDDEVPFRANVLDAIILLCAAWSDVSSTTIKNCFHHCGFSLDGEAQDPPDEEEDEQQGEAGNVDEDLLARLNVILPDSPPEDVLEDWLHCDEDILTTSELSDTQIIELAQNETYNNSDEQDEIAIQKPTTAEVRKALKTLQDYCLCSQADPSVLDSIDFLQTRLNNVIASQATQTKVTDFFSHQ